MAFNMGFWGVQLGWVSSLLVDYVNIFHKRVAHTSDPPTSKSDILPPYISTTIAYLVFSLDICVLERYFRLLREFKILYRLRNIYFGIIG
jgi:hypothetical protein